MTRALGRTLVTGAHGFLGTALVARLRAMGVDVVASDMGDLENPCDVTDAAQVDALCRSGGFATILHCGAVSGPMVMADQPLEIWRINAQGTAHVLEAARTHAVARVVICSTSEVYGATPGRVDEATLPQPRSVYAASKVAAEQAVLGYVREHGLDAMALRLSWIYGPGRRTPTRLETLLCGMAADHPVTLDADPAEMTHYLHLDDAVQALIRAAEVETPGGRICNITAGPGIPMRDVAAIAASLRPGARIAFRTPGALAGSVSDGPSNIAHDLATASLGFRPEVPLASGIARLLATLPNGRDCAPFRHGPSRAG
ncbi:NAD(P)-dependent oxidoreductase [Paracoccaceae bacterium Fryx2]|nr:NAD(P)-dependent oxidoreductase [Paracoccaceae bacterium Fryx2]